MISHCKISSGEHFIYLLDYVVGKDQSRAARRLPLLRRTPAHGPKLAKAKKPAMSLYCRAISYFTTTDAVFRLAVPRSQRETIFCRDKCDLPTVSRSSLSRNKLLPLYVMEFLHKSALADGIE